MARGIPEKMVKRDKVSATRTRQAPGACSMEQQTRKGNKATESSSCREKAGRQAATETEDTESETPSRTSLTVKFQQLAKQQKVGGPAETAGLLPLAPRRVKHNSYRANARDSAQVFSVRRRARIHCPFHDRPTDLMVPYLACAEPEAGRD
jgi:hypothetical protein